MSSPLIKCVDRGDDSAVVGELDLDAVRIPEREQLDRLAGRNLGQTVWAELRGSRYNLARAREKEYVARRRDGQKPAQILSGLLLKPSLAKRIRSAESNPLR